MPTIANVIPLTPKPDAFTLIASAIRDAGYGPEKAASLVAGFEHAAELTERICAALAGMPPLEARLSASGIGAVLAVSGPA